MQEIENNQVMGPVCDDRPAALATSAACAPEQPAHDSARVLVSGAANAGKTALALERVRALLAGGSEPSQVLVVCASPVAARDFSARLGAAGAGVRVCCARDLELELLGQPQAQALTGRRARVLCDFEESFLLEDMRATGVAAKRLKGMLGFFRKSLTELADDDMDSFIIDIREQAVLDALHAHLAAYDAMLDCEVGNLCVHYLRECPQAAQALGVEHIVADDFQCLNRASQHVLELLGARTLWAFADPALAPQGDDPFPYPAGVEELRAHDGGCVEVRLPDPAAGAAAASACLVSSGYLTALTPGLAESRGKVEQAQAYEVAPHAGGLEGIAQRVYAGPEEELAGVVAGVCDVLADGADPSQVLVLAPNRAWATRVAQGLEGRGVAVELHGAVRVAGGSFRDLALCRTGRMYTALSLLADPDDALAWRCWCGCGDYLARSNVFCGVEDLARERGCGLAQALELLENGQAGPLPAQEGMLVAYRQGREMIAGLAGLTGVALLAELASGLGLDAVPEPYASLVERGLATPEADAAELLAAAQGLTRAAAARPGAVRVGLYGLAGGFKAERVFVCGLMNGWLPEHAYFDLAEADFDARAKIDARARRTLCELATCAGQSLTLSGFARCDLELAERMHLKGYKVAMGADGRRTTTVRPSDLAAYALHVWGLAPLPARPLVRDFAPARVNA